MKQPIRYYRVWFTNGSDRTAGVVCDTKLYPMNKTTIATYSRMFPFSEAIKMKRFHMTQAFDTWNEAFNAPY